MAFIGEKSLAVSASGNVRMCPHVKVGGRYRMKEAHGSLPNDCYGLIAD